MPRADRTPAWTGTRASGHPQGLGQGADVQPARPTKGGQDEAAWVFPRCTEMTRRARAMCSLASSMMPWAACSAVRPHGVGQAPDRRPGGGQVQGHAPTQEGIRASAGPGPDWHRSPWARSRRARSRPGPGSAPADSGPTSKAPPGSRRAMEPPPAPMVCMSTMGTATGIAGHPTLAGQAWLPGDQGHVRGGPAHVEAQQPLATRQPTDEAGPHQAAGRSRQQQAHRTPGGLFRRHRLAASSASPPGSRRATRRPGARGNAPPGARPRR